MSSNVIRQDVIEVSVDTNSDALAQLTKELQELKKQLGGIDASKPAKEVDKLGNTDTRKTNDGLKQIKDNLTDIGNKAATKAYNGLKKVAGISFKALTVGVAAAAAGVGALVKNAVSAYAEYEQLVGGVDTIFKGASGTVQKNAANAFKTAGLSANDYMSTITTFSASLIQSLKGDTAKAATLADRAISDMGDNANKMGTDISMIQNAYSSFARGQYMLLDNLKLGYAGTKGEMERLLSDAGKIAGKSFDISSYADIIEAIHVIQENMGITGTTAKEAKHTITGSLNAFRSAWSNLMPALVRGGDAFDTCMDNLVETALALMDNLMPAIEKALLGVGTFIERIAPVLEERFPELIEKLLPPLLKAAVSLVKGLIKALPTIIKTVVQELPNILKEVSLAIAEAFGMDSSIFDKIGNFFAENAEKIKTFGGVLLGIIGALLAFKKVKGMASFFTGLFGIFGKKQLGGEGGKGGLFGGFFDNLAKLKTTTILKAFANLAIIISGMGLLAFAFAKVAPYIADIEDFTVMLKAGLVITALGVIGAALSKLGEIAGKIPVSIVAKGLANMAIMISGLTALAVVINLVLSVSNFDYAGILKLAGMITVLGAVGTVLAAFAGIVGNIPVSTVSLGLANMAIMISGLTAVLWAMNWVLSVANFDFGGLLKIIGMISLLGTVGSVLAIFAGIVGLIPIPTVLLGLANIALALNGITLILAEYAALSKIPGFTDFIKTGGEVLVTIFNIIGKIVGSLVGGAFEGIASSLPKIGESLADFGENIKPLFEAFKGVDMSSIGTFFGALGAFMLQLAGDKLISFFTGGTDLGELGTQLNTFAENAKGFFEKVATFPENGFTNATKLFECLSGLGNLPGTGGLKQWFQGEIEYDKISEGLKALSSENVSGFFAFVQGVTPEAFSNAEKLFECLNGIGNLPATGGLKQWFTGEIDYAKIAAGLESLSSEGVKKFFEMAGALSPQAFENTTALFNSLAGINGLPSEGGFWQWLTGEKTSLSELADNLAYFGEKTPGFFEAINGLNLENLSGLWESLKGAEGLTAESLKGVSELLDNLTNKAIELPKKMGDGIKEAGNSLSEALVHIWQEAARAMADPVNKIIGGANWILKEFGSGEMIAAWQPYAKGTDGHKGGNAMVNDGRGAELVQMPNGRMFIPKGRNVFLPNAPAGMKVLPAEQTAKLLGKKSPTFHYAKGIGDIDLFSYYDNASGLVNEIKKLVSYEGMSGFALHAGKAMVSTITGPMESWVEGLFSKFQSKFSTAGGGVPNLSGYVASAGVNQWKSIVEQALKMEGQYSEANVRRTLYQMQTESSGNPAAINNWDINAKRGTPSKGLMQVIDPTFKAYARPGFDSNIYDPMSNVLASIRYAKSRYGSLENAYRGVGYANGVGTVSLPEQSDISMRYTPENSYTGGRTEVTETNNYSPVFNLTINGATDTRTQARQVKAWIQEAMDEMFASMARKARV